MNSGNFNPLPDTSIVLGADGSFRETVHVFDQKSIWAVQAALAAGRPLLIRGEPGVGKTQLARAVAATLNWRFLYHVVHPRTEPDDLLFSYDAVARIAHAQTSSANIAPKLFIRPGPFWWAINSTTAAEQDLICRTACQEVKPIPGIKPTIDVRRAVLLIDEIDKADSDVPNALLESLANQGFQVPQLDASVKAATEVGPDGAEVAQTPLVILTTNEERELPGAVLRRCLVLNLTMGKTEDEKRNFLLRRGREHFSQPESSPKLEARLLEKVAEWLLRERAAMTENYRWKPGPAEYLDILRALGNLNRNTDEQIKHLDKLAEFGFRKQREVAS